MGRTRSYREQHREIIRLAGSLTARLDPEGLAQHAVFVHADLLDLAAVLRLHLVLEDHTLYPELLSHPNPQVRTLTHQYQLEMGNIHGDFEALLERWPSSESISAAPGQFTAELLAFFQVLHHRMRKEDGELYPLVDSLES